MPSLYENHKNALTYCCSHEYPLGNHESTADNAAPQTEPSPEQAEPPAYQKPPRAKLRQVWPLSVLVQEKLVAHYGAMSQRGAEVQYTDNEGKKVKRKAKPRESLRSMKMCHTIGRLALRQQKLDARLATDDDGDKTLNDFVTEVVALAGDRMADEAEALGLECAAELPAARVDEIFEEEQKKFDAQKGPPQTPQRPRSGRDSRRRAQRLDHSHGDAGRDHDAADGYGVARGLGVPGAEASGAADGGSAAVAVLRVASGAAVCGSADSGEGSR